MVSSIFYRRWVTYYVASKLTNPLLLSRSGLASSRMCSNQDATVCLGSLEVSWLVISLFGSNNWMSAVRPRQRSIPSIKVIIKCYVIWKILSYLTPCYHMLAGIIRFVAFISFWQRIKIGMTEFLLWVLCFWTRCSRTKKWSILMNAG